MIRADGIDILIDLAGHTANNSLPAFTCKPAPIQVSWIGYPNTTGLGTIDYRITDHWCDPTGMTEHLSTEQLIRLPESVWCYQPPEAAQQDVGPLPADANGYITIGSVNNYAKITAQVLDAWARVLARVPNARLLMQSSPLGFPTAGNFVRDFMNQRGISPDRVTLKGWVKLEDYFQTLRAFDLTLDPFPFNGGTTTCHTLWAGLPTVSLAGRNHVSRMGVSMLSNIGLQELIAKKVDEYVERSVALATDIPRLRQLRSSLRDRMSASALIDAARITRQVESEYRQIWQRYCAQSGALK